MVIGIRSIDTIGKEACCTAHAQRVVLRERCAEHFVLPVSVGVAELCDSAFALETVTDNVSKCSTVHKIKSLAGSVHMPVGSEVDLGLAGCTFLGGDDDDTVRRTRTVDSGCRSVLKYGH